jgi:hypothetical protein
VLVEIPKWVIAALPKMLEDETQALLDLAEKIRIIAHLG